MTNNFLITVPLYISHDLNDLYDHPTPFNNFQYHETCSRLIASIINNLPIDCSADIILLYGRTGEAAISNEEVDRLLEQTFLQTLSQKNNSRLFLAGDTFLTSTQYLIAKHEFSFPINNIGYGNVRNLQLVLHAILGNKRMINLDDDEIIRDETFFTEIKAMDTILEREEYIGGLGGLYVDENGNPDILPNTANARLTTNIFSKKEFFMQEMISLYSKTQLKVPASIVFGGLTYVDERIAKSVCYDPFIQRGEDGDFLINAIFKKLYFAMYNNWTIEHKPPGKSLGSGHIPTLEKKRRDVKRFIYEKAKIEQMCHAYSFDKNTVFSILSPYPAPFFMESYDQLINDASEISSDLDLHYFLKHEVPNNINSFLDYFSQWPEVVKTLVENREGLRKSLIQIF